MYNKKSLTGIKLLFILFLAIFSFCQFSFAQEEKNTKKTVLKVGYSKNSGVINNIDSLDEQGFGYEILMRAEHYSNYTFEFIKYDSSELLHALANGEIDVMGIALDNGTIPDAYTFVSKPLGTTQLILASKEEGLSYDNPQAINGKVVASFHNNPCEKSFDAYCAANNISVTYVRDNMSDYIKQKADFYLVTTINSDVKDFYMVMNLEVFPMYFLTTKKNQPLADALAKAITLSVSADGRFLEELQMKYYGSKNLTRRYLTIDELKLLRNKILTCGYIDHHQPIQYTNAAGLPDGVSVHVMNKLAKNFDFTLQYVPYNHGMPNHLHERFDMLISATGDYEHEMAFYTPSKPFMELPILLFAKKGFIEEIVLDSYASTLGMLNYITLDYKDVAERYPNNSVKSYGTFEALMAGYKNGEIDGILATENGVEYAQAVFGEDLYTIRSTGLSLPLRIFLSNKLENLTEYIGAFNVMFEHVDQNIIDEIMSMQSVSFLPEYTVEKFLQDHLPLILIILLGMMLIVVCIIFYLQYKKKQAVLKIVNYDDLTDLFSLYYFKGKATKLLQTVAPDEYEMISLDIDSFHTINKMYGQEKGNVVIHAVAQVLREVYREPTDLVSRIIADQFVIFHKTQDEKCIENICKNEIYSKVRSLLGEKYNISISVGSCVISDPTLEIDEIIDATVAARQKGKQKYTFTHYAYNSDIKKDQEMRTSIVYRMRTALHDQEFKVFYQPKIRFDTLRIGGAEALVRWESKSNYGVSPPDMFIGIFESNGFIVEVDLYVFEEVCKFVVAHQDTIAIPTISINMSAITLFDDRVPAAYFEILSKYQLNPHHLELEITESSMTLDMNILKEKIKEIRTMGFAVSIDDFGTGESSLNRLSAIDIDTIKLDKAFLDSNIIEKKGAVVVDNVIRMVKQLSMQVVSEGVETAEQATWLRGLNCDYAQGYFFEKPMNEHAFLNLLHADKTYTI